MNKFKLSDSNISLSRRSIVTFRHLCLIIFRRTSHYRRTSIPSLPLWLPLIRGIPPCHFRWPLRAHQHSSEILDSPHLLLPHRINLGNNPYHRRHIKQIPMHLFHLRQCLSIALHELMDFSFGGRHGEFEVVLEGLEVGDARVA